MISKLDESVGVLGTEQSVEEIPSIVRNLWELIMN
jgi:hypothetical protein